MCFSTSGRTVSKYRGIVTVENVIKKTSGSRFVDLSLRGALVEDSIKGKGLVLNTRLSVWDDAPRELLNGVIFGGIEDSS